jgi:hypothetical protein
LATARWKVAGSAWWVAYRTGLMSSQAGTAVLRPAYFAFLPSEGSKNLLTLGGGLANVLGRSTMGVEVITAEAKLPFDLLIPILYAQDARRFDATIRRVATEFGGVVWTPGEPTITREVFPLQSSRESLLFHVGRDTVRGAPQKSQVPIANGLVARWSPDKPVERREPTPGS